MKDKRKLLILLLIIVIAAVLISRNFLNKSQTNPNIIRVSGNIEVIDAEVSFKIPGRVETRLLSEGDTVKAGQIVARLDAKELSGEVAVRKAEVQAAQAVLAELEAGSRPEEIAQANASVQKAQAALDKLLAGSRPQEEAAADAEVQRAKAEVDRARDEYERQKSLYDQGVASAQMYEAAKTAYEVANAMLKVILEQQGLVEEGPRKEDIEQAQAALKEAKERYALVKSGPRKQTIEQARARVEQADAGLTLVEMHLGYATLVSPLTGVVLSEGVEPGEYVIPGTPVVTVGDLKKVYLRAYINETDLGRVKLGQKVRITTDTYPDKVYGGYISFIASQAEFTPRNVQTPKERVKLVYRVKMEIPNPNMELKPGMPADSEILLGSGSKK